MKTKEQGRELSVLTTLSKSKNRNLLQLLHHIYDEENGVLYLALELCSHNLKTHVEKNQHAFTEFQLKDLLQQLANGYGELRKNGIIHRDVKPSNILVTEDGGRTTFKLADFGYSRFMNPEESMKTMTVAGTPAYMAPEILVALGSGVVPFGPKGDVFSFGMVALFCLSRNDIKVQDRYTPDKLKNQVATILDSRPTLSSTLKGHLQKMLEFDPKDRMTDGEFVSIFTAGFTITVARNIVCFAPTAEMIVIADDEDIDLRMAGAHQ